MDVLAWSYVLPLWIVISNKLKDSRAIYFKTSVWKKIVVKEVILVNKWVFRSFCKESLKFHRFYSSRGMAKAYCFTNQQMFLVVLVFHLLAIVTSYLFCSYLFFYDYLTDFSLPFCFCFFLIYLKFSSISLKRLLGKGITSTNIKYFYNNHLKVGFYYRPRQSSGSRYSLVQR